VAFPVFPPISIRLTRCQYDLIAPGFRRIASLHAYCVANGVKPIFYLLAFSPRPNTTKGRYDQALIAALLSPLPVGAAASGSPLFRSSF
jgi:hypothetical protein